MACHRPLQPPAGARAGPGRFQALFGGHVCTPYNPPVSGSGPAGPISYPREEAALSAETDRKFFDTFMLVLGILVVVTIAIYVLASWISGRTQAVHIKEDPAFQQRVVERIQPIGQVAIAGQDNTGLRDPGGVAPAEMAAAPAAADRTADLDGEAVYKAACTACHGAGIAGAPKTGDQGAWAARLEQGMDTLVEHAIKGFQGQAGYMPPRGGHANLTDEQVRDAVQHMVDALEG
jgi:cytochrome c5